MKDPQIGQKVGSYVIASLLGKGGFGKVYLGIHPRIGSKVAIKILNEEYSEDIVVLQRFISEAKAVNIISHPNIVQIFDFNSLPEPDGRFYCVMEYIKGKVLTEYLPALAGTFGDTHLNIIHQIAQGLDAAHEKGVVHRDLKPDNIILSKKGDQLNVKILDFGIAKLTSTTDATSIKTKTGTIIGTPAYMSPEQAKGETENISSATDVYSMGAIIYHMISGEVPISGNSISQILIRLITEQPVPLREKIPGISEEINEVVLNCLIKIPQQRTQSAKEVYRLLDRAYKQIASVPKNDISDTLVYNNISLKLPSITSDDDIKIPKQSDILETTGTDSATTDSVVNTTLSGSSGHTKKALFPKFAIVMFMILLIFGGSFLLWTVMKKNKNQVEKQYDITKVISKNIESNRNNTNHLVAKNKITRNYKIEKIARADNSNTSLSTKNKSKTTEQKVVPLVEIVKKGHNFTIPNLGMAFIYIKPGTFNMGTNRRDDSTNEYPVRRVKIINHLWMGKYEVTQEEYSMIMGNNPSSFKGTRRPVENISWNDAVSFCKKLTKREQKKGRLSKEMRYRLPTEVEWEYSARGGNKSRGFKFSGSNTLHKAGWFYKNSGNKTRSVGRRKANELGIYDMSGNVYEWCSDLYSKKDSTEKKSNLSNLSRVYRGGGWCNDGNSCSSTSRSGDVPSIKYDFVGFRVLISK
jgi:eukaryotic-like serine/threonine-protein kinase